MKQHRQKLALGQSDFREFRKAGAYYVDKSLLVRELIQCSYQSVLLPRPRRFGKTLNLSMLRYFFERSEERAAELFEGLAIRREADFQQHHAQYPVIYMTFKDVKHAAWTDCLEHLKDVIYKEYERHREILQNDAFPPEEKAYYQKILNGEQTSAAYEYSLGRLSEYLSRTYGNKCIILIDEYDTPIQAGYAYGYYQKIIGFMRNFLSGGLKDNSHLFKGVLSGILRVAKESIFSGLNNLGAYSLLTEDFNTAFGFTEEEVRDLLECYGLTERYQEIADWYNGYLFGGEVIYNPWSVLNYVNSRSHTPKAYWVNTADTGLLEKFITRGGQELREELGDLIAGKPIVKPLHENIVMRDIERREDLLWSFLLFSGYLTYSGEARQRNRHILRIPNQEVRQVYEDIVEHWFVEKVDLSRLEEMLNALQHGEVQMFDRILRRIVTEIMSYHDLSGEPEKVYQALVMGMLVWLSHDYEIRSNRESGYGRYDILLKPKDLNKTGIILEFKQVFENERPETVLKNALRQIEERRYATELTASGIRRILKIAIVFRGKELWLKSLPEERGI